jgi:hypothetical protein
MCWACEEPNYQTASFRLCSGCSKLYPLDDLKIYNFVKQWRGLYNWIQGEVWETLLCQDCAKDMDDLRENARRDATNERLSLPEPRIKDRKVGAIPIGIHGNRQTLGIRCAQLTYGVNATEEILQGFLYRDDDGLIVRRVVIEEVDETKRCDKCWLTLWQCNAREVTR